jgi:hypothetical protein
MYIQANEQIYFMIYVVWGMRVDEDGLSSPSPLLKIFFSIFAIA